MARSIILSNGELAVALDEHALVRDVYYPYVGLEDHVRGHYIHRVGVWVEGELSWLGEDSVWKIEVRSREDALVSDVVAVHERLQVELHGADAVYNERPVFVRRFRVKNIASREREIKLYFAHQFEIYKSHGGDTAYFDPVTHAIIHYKGRRVFLISAMLDEEPFNDYATGIANIHEKEGTHRDAEDGALSKNPIEHGPADSVIGLYASYAPGQERTCDYTLAAARSIRDAHALYTDVEKKTPAHLLRTTGDYWKAWLGANERSFADLSAEQVSLFNRSLMFVRAHVDARGGVLASLDSDMLNYGLDTYSYVWPRDAAYATLALDAAGDTNVAKRFFEFCRELFGGEGYLLHKYRPDGSLGSSWHPWILDGRFQLPIQEDETAIVLWAFREHFRRSRDLEFLEAMYESLVEKPAEFMLQYRDPFTKLPQPSYELWEEQRGVSTYTSACVYGALSAAADLASVLGKVQEAQRYQIGAREIAEGIMAHLWDEKRHVFYKLFSGDEERVYDTAIDISSPYGIFAFGVLPQNDPRLAAAFSASVRALSHGIPIGGVARYQGDQYGRVDTESAGNPWVNTTLWYAEFLIANAATESDFSKIRDIFSWVEARASRSGALSEQFDPRTGAGVSASPLVWSHVGYVLAVLKYLERKKALQSQR